MITAPNIDIPLSFNFVCRFVATGSRPQTAQDLDRLANAGVTRIINVCDVADPIHKEAAAGRCYTRTDAYWNPTADDGQHGDEKVQWILRSLRWWQANAQPPQACLAHCFDGLSRGPSTAYAILLAMGLFTYDAKALIHKYRPATWIGIRYSDDAERALALL